MILIGFSVDTLRLVKPIFSWEAKGLVKKGFKQKQHCDKKTNKYIGQKYFDNGEKGEPNITACPVQYPKGPSYNLIASITPATIFYDTNTTLLTIDELGEMLTFVTGNITSRTDIEFNAPLTKVTRVDLALDSWVTSKESAELFNHYREFNIARLERRFVETTIYCESKTKSTSKPLSIKIYDKTLQSGVSVDGDMRIIRIEVSYCKHAIKALAKKIGLQSEFTAKELLSTETLEFVKKSLFEKLRLKQWFGQSDNTIERIFAKTKDAELAQKLFVFIKALERYGHNFYLSHPNLGFSKSTYYRMMKKIKEYDLSI